MTSMHTSTAVVEVERAARFGKQLVNHLGRRYGGQWTPDTSSGWIDLQTGTAQITADGNN